MNVISLIGARQVDEVQLRAHYTRAGCLMAIFFPHTLLDDHLKYRVTPAAEQIQFSVAPCPVSVSYF